MRKLSRLFWYVIPLGLVLAWAVPAMGQEPIPRCQTHEGMLADLTKYYDEYVVARGTAGGNVVELLVSGDGRTWSLIVTDPNTATCVVAAGRDWEVMPVKRGRPS